MADIVIPDALMTLWQNLLTHYTQSVKMELRRKDIDEEEDVGEIN